MVLKSLQKACFSSSSSHLECNSFWTRLEQRKPGAWSSRRYFCAFWLRKRSERYRSWTSEAKLHKKVLLSLPSTCLLLAVTATRATTGSDPGDIIYGHGEHTWPLVINLMVHVKIRRVGEFKTHFLAMVSSKKKLEIPPRRLKAI